jgi:hypothetical protein
MADADGKTTRQSAERARLEEAREWDSPWRKWGPYLSERQWGTVREDCSHNGDAWHEEDVHRQPHGAAPVRVPRGFVSCGMSHGFRQKDTLQAIGDALVAVLAQIFSTVDARRALESSKKELLALFGSGNRAHGRETQSP